MWFLKRKPLITLGIDLSRFSIEACALTSARDVTAHERVEWDNDSIKFDSQGRNDMLRVKLDQVLAKIRKRIGNLHGVRVVANVPEQHTYAHYFDVPVDLSGNELLTHLTKKARLVIPLEPQDMTAAYAVLEKSEIHNSTKRVLFAAAPKDVIRSILETLRAVGVDSPVLDIESMALMRSLLPVADQSGAVCIIDGGSETSSIHIFEGLSAPVMSVAYPEGGMHATQRIAEKLKLPFAEAEKLKLAFGFLQAPRLRAESDAEQPRAETDSQTPGGAVSKDVSLILHTWCQPLISEFCKTAAYYEAHNKKRVTHVILAGGMALAPGIAPYLTAALERSVRIGNPLRNLRNTEILGKERPSILYATCIGLALHGADSSLAGVDFTEGIITETKRGIFI